MAKAWEIRITNFPSVLSAYKPVQTMSVSVTGNSCALDCAHCGGHYLKAMRSLADLENFTGTSCLISGGCGTQGKVGIVDKIPELQRLKGRKRYNFHVGLMEEAELQAVGPLADVISFDFVGSDETIREVFGLERTVDDYIACYRNLRCHAKVVPHICVGLHGGEIVGEYRALELLKELGCDSLTFIVLIPTKGTRYEHVTPVDLQQVAELFCYARLLFPSIEINLGCMRPGGLYRQELDCLAVQCGLNGIVQPHRKALALAESLQLAIREAKECCSL